MGIGFAPTWLRQVSPLLRMTTLTTAVGVKSPPRNSHTDHVVLDGGACDLAVVEDLEPLQATAGGDVFQTLVGDLHAAVQLQYGQVVGDCRARAQASHAVVRYPPAIRHTLYVQHTHTHM